MPPPPLSSFLVTAVATGSLRLAHSIHGQLHILGLHRDTFLTAQLISTYSRLSLPSLSRLVFDSNPQNLSNLALWNAVLAAYLRNGIFSESISLFKRLWNACMLPDSFTLSIVTKAATELRQLTTGEMIHTMILKLGLSSDCVLYNSVMGLYSKCGEFCCARNVFDEMPLRSVASWNMMMSEFRDLGNVGSKLNVWKLLVQMQEEGLNLDAYTLSLTLPLCEKCYGKEIHGYAIKHGLDSDLHVQSCLIDMYSRTKDVAFARCIFDRIFVKNVVVWTAMISGYVDNECFEKALEHFRLMCLRNDVVPNMITLVAILPAIGYLASFLEGKQVHGFSFRLGLSAEVSLNNALIDMYSKCGSVVYASRVFDSNSWEKDVISWSSMLKCHATHGRAKEAILLFRRMCNLGIEVDHISSISILSSCGKGGLVTEGIDIYNSLVNDHGISPSMEMYSCVVDMLGRAGKLNEALDFINNMPLVPSPSVWGALFSASIIHNNKEMQDHAYRSIIQSEPENPSNYVSISNIHAFAGRWNSVVEVRTQMRERGLEKITGCSWIKVNLRTHSFVVADKTHCCSDMIYSALDSLVLAMREANYEPNFERFIY